MVIGSAAAALAGCGGSGSGRSTSEPVGVGLLIVEQVQDGGPYYIEGARSYVRADRQGVHGDVVELSRGTKPAARLQLDPDVYKLESWQRPCDGNCTALDPPTDRCSGGFSVIAGEQVRVTIILEPGKGCRIVVSPDS